MGDYGPQIAARRVEGEVFTGDRRPLNHYGHAALGDLLAADFARWLRRHRPRLARAAGPSRSGR